MLCVLMSGFALVTPVHGMTMNHYSAVRKHMKVETQDIRRYEDDDGEYNKHRYRTNEN